MDLDALHRHMTEFKQLKPRLLKVLEFVEGIMTSGAAPTAGATPDTTLADQIGTLRQDVTKLDDRMDVLDKFKEDVLPVLDKVPAFLELMTKLEGFDPVAVEERLTTVEGSIQEIGAALDPTAEKPPEASGSDGATPGQGAAPVATAQDEATEQPDPAPAAPAAS